MESRPFNRRTALTGIAGLSIGAAGLGASELTTESAGSPGQAQPGGKCDFVVSPSDSIQATIDVAAAGDSICVEPGTYAESLTVDKADLTLRSTESREATLDVRGQGTGIRIHADGVTVEGFEIVGDGGTTSGISINTTAGATADLTIKDNHVHGMAKGGGGGPFGIGSWGILSWGDTPLSGVLIEDNRIEDIADSDSSRPVGIGIHLGEVEGDRPRAGAVVRRNTLRNVHGARVEILGTGITLPGIGIMVQPMDGESSGAGDPATDVQQNTIASTWIDVVLGEVGLTRVMNND